MTIEDFRKTQEYAEKPLDQTLEELGADRERGLSAEEAGKRLDRYGFNEIEEKEETLWHRIFRRFWGPLPWMIEAAAVLSAMVRKWEDFVIILLQGAVARLELMSEITRRG